MRHVLIVDDQPGICDLVRTLLEDTGDYQVSTALTGEQALPLLDANQPDLIVLDAVLPGMHGTELAMRAVERCIPVIIMTGEPDMEERLKELGWPHLSKPFGMGQLSDEIRRAIEHAEENLRLVRAALDRVTEIP